MNYFETNLKRDVSRSGHKVVFFERCVVTYDALPYTAYHNWEGDTGKTHYYFTPSEFKPTFADIALCRTFETINPG